MKRDGSVQSHAGPPLLLLALVHVLLFAASLVAGALLRHGSAYVNPYAAAEVVRDFFAQNPTAVRVSGFFLFSSAVPLGLFAATVVSRLRFLGVRAAGVYIALFGGFAASGALAISGLFGWVLSVPEVSASVPAVRAIYFLIFLFGGTGFAVGFGLLAAGVSVTSHFACLLRPWVIGLGILIAAAGELSPLSLLAYPATFLIPITRFAGFVWLLAVAAMLPRKRNGSLNGTGVLTM
jgi:hypothetical protein